MSRRKPVPVLVHNYRIGNGLILFRSKQSKDQDPTLRHKKTASGVHRKNDKSFLWVQICKNHRSQQCCGSGPCRQKAINEKTLIPTILWLLFDFSPMKTDVNVPSKVIRKMFFRTPHFWLVRQWRKSRIRIWSHIRKSLIRISDYPDPYQSVKNPKHQFCQYKGKNRKQRCLQVLILARRRETTGNPNGRLKEKYACYCFWNLGGRWADLHPREHNRSIRWLLQW